MNKGLYALHHNAYSQKIAILQFLPLIFLWGAFMSVSPFVIDHAIFGGMFKPAFALFFLASAMFLLLKKMITLPFLLWLPFSQIVVFTIYYLFKFDIYYLAFVVRLLTFCFTITLIHNLFGWEMFIKSFVNIMVWLAFLGTIGFFLGLSGFQPVSIFQNPDTRTAYNFILTFSNSILGIGPVIIMRLASFFDEPGTFGFFLTFAILLNRLTLFSLKKEIALILGGLLTFSLAFYLNMFFYMLFFYAGPKQIKGMLLLAVIFASFFASIHYKQDESPTWQMLHRITLGRLERTDNAVIAGDNRSVLFARAYTIWQEHFFWGGMPSLLSEEHGFYGANMISPFADHGLWGAIVYYLPILYATFLSVFKKNSKHFFVISILWVQYLQRPNLGALFEYICMISIICAFSFKYSELKSYPGNFLAFCRNNSFRADSSRSKTNLSLQERTT